MNSDILIRDHKESDISFVYATWLHTYKHNSYFAKRIRDHVFFKYHHKIIEGILNRTTSKILIAADKADPDVILGYIVYESFGTDTNIVHFIYIKKNFRGFGISRKLFVESKLKLPELMFSHWCFDVNWILAKHPDLIYNPYLV